MQQYLLKRFQTTQVSVYAKTAEETSSVEVNSAMRGYDPVMWFKAAIFHRHNENDCGESIEQIDKRIQTQPPIIAIKMSG